MASGIKTTIELDVNQFKQQLQDALKQANIDGLKIKEILNNLKVKIDDKDFKTSFNNVKVEAEKTASAVEKAFSGKSFAQKMFDFNQINQATTQLTSSMMGLVTPYNAIDKKGRELASLGVKNFKELEKAALEVQKTSGTSAADMLGAMYEAVAGGGFTVKDGIADVKAGMAFIRNARDLAKAGQIDNTTATKTLTASINAYGISLEGKSEAETNKIAKSFSDAMFAAQAATGFNIESFSQTLGQVTPIAAAVGIKFQDLTASMGTLKKGGVGAAESATKVRAILEELQKPSSQLATYMGKAGVSMDSLKTKSLTENLMMLKKVAKESGVEINSIFSRSEAGSGALGLTQEVNGIAKGMTILEKASGQADGATKRAYDLMKAGTEQKVKDFQSKIKAYFTEFAGALGQPFAIFLQQLPIIQSSVVTISALTNIIPKSALESIGKSFKSMTNTISSSVGSAFDLVAKKTAPLMNGIMQNITPIASNIKNSLAPIGSSLLTIGRNVLASVIPSLAATEVATATTGTTAMTTAGAFRVLWSAITGPVGIAIAGVLAVGGAFYLLYKNSETFRNFINEIGKVISIVFTGIWNVIKSVGSVIFSIGQVIFQWLILPFKIVYNIASTVIAKILEAFGIGGKGQKFEFAKTVQDFFTWIVANIDNFSKYIDNIANIIGAVAQTIGEFIGNYIAPVIVGAIKLIVGVFQEFWNIGVKLGEWIGNAFKFVWDNLVETFKTVYNWIANLIKRFVSFSSEVKGKFAFLGTMFEPMKRAFDVVYNWIANKINAIGNFVGDVTNRVKQIIGLGGDKKTETKEENVKAPEPDKNSLEIYEKFANQLGEIKQKIIDNAYTQSEFDAALGKKALVKQKGKVEAALTDLVSTGKMTAEERTKTLVAMDNRIREIRDLWRNKNKKEKKTGEKIDLGLELAKIDEAIINDTNKKLNDLNKKSIENRITQLEDYKNEIQNNDKLTETERLKLTLETDNKILESKRELANNDIQLKANNELIKSQESVINVFAKRKDVKELKAPLENYQKQLNEIQSDEVLSEFEKSEKIKTLTQNTYDELGKIAKDKKLVTNQELEKIQTDLNKNIEISNETLNTNLKNSNDKFNKDKNKQDEDGNKKIKASQFNDEKTLLDNKIKLIVANNKEQVNKRLDLQLQLIELEYNNEINSKKLTSEEKLVKEKEYNEKIKILRLNANKDINSVELSENKALYENKLLDLKESYRKELDLAADNVNLQLRAEKKFYNESLIAKKDYLRKESILYDLTYNVIDNIKKVFSDDEKQRNEDEINTKKTALNQQAKDYEAMLLRNEISYKEYQEKFAILQKQQDDLEKERAQNRFNVVDKINKALVASFTTMNETLNKRLKNSLDDIEAYMDNTEGSMGEKLSAAKGALLQYSIDSLAVLGGTAAQALVQGENVGQAVIKQAITILEALIPIFVAQLFGITSASPENILTLGGWGIAKFALLTGALYGLAEIAKAKIPKIGGSWGAYTGYLPGTKGYNNRVDSQDTKNVNVTPHEAILTESMTSSEMPLLKYWFNGKSTKEYIKDNLGKFINTKDLSTSTINDFVNNENFKSFNHNLGYELSHETYKQYQITNNYNTYNQLQNKETKSKHSFEFQNSPFKLRGNDLYSVTEKIKKHEIKKW